MFRHMHLTMKFHVGSQIKAIPQNIYNYFQNYLVPLLLIVTESSPKLLPRFIFNRPQIIRLIYDEIAEG